ncbi:PREDICTED: F-box protein At1g31080-like isoform X1 [Camelina sativa]|uniref:F-box protein At1g31080-like isoform X1 n=1 Tax=Camelina sativa TaxID=90675 RepID=A0ABM0WV97_CAMSA|nr:PREDICTED: F-box protein At1g31080-like isoform X1 [Camelina sativa]
MNRGANSVSLPNDLIYEILSRLPAKSIKRFRCVSKLWESIICRKDFTELFHTRSLSNPRLLLIKAQRGGQWSFFSMPQNHYGKSSFVVADSFQMKGGNELVFHILTLGTGKMRWRNIQCPTNHVPIPRCEGICINGVLYYLAQQTDEWNEVIVCFDVRSEKFKFLLLQVEFVKWPTQLINYKGKVGMILEDGNKRRFPLKLHIWVLEDVGKEELTAYAYTLRDENRVDNGHSILCVARVTASGEIVLANTLYKPYYVYFFNLERNTLRRVEIPEEEKWSWDHRVYYFVDHVEDLRFDVMKTTYAAKSISRPEQSTSSSRGDHQVTTVAHEQQDY